MAIYITATLAVLFVFSLVFSPSLQRDIGTQQVVASVGSAKVSKQDYYMAYQTLENQIVPPGQTVNRKLLDKMIDQEVWVWLHTRFSIQAMMDAYGFITPTRMIEASIKQDPFFQVKGKYSANKFKTFINQRQLSIAHFMQIKSTDMMQNATLSIISEISQPIASEIDWFKEVASIQRQYSIKKIQVDAQKISTPSEDAMKTYYKNHLLDFVMPSQFQYQYTIISKDTFNTKQPSQDELKAFFEEHIDQYIIPEQILMQVHLLKKNKDHTLSSAETAFIGTYLGVQKELDQIIDSVNTRNGKGYELTNQDPVWKTVTQLPPEFSSRKFVYDQNPLINVADDGSVYIVENKSHEKETIPKFEMVVSKVQADYKNYILNELYQTKMDELTDRAYGHEIAWPALKKEYPNLVIKKTPLTGILSLAKYSPFKDNPQLSKWIFEQQNTDGILLKSMSGNKTLLIQKIKYLPKHTQKFEQAKPEILKILEHAEKLEMAKKQASKSFDIVKTAKDPKGLNSSWQYHPKASYAYNNLSLPAEVWSLILKQNTNNSVLKVDTLAEQTNQIYISRWWKDQKVTLNEVFYQQMMKDWQGAFMISSINLLVEQYSLKKYV